MKNLKIEGLKYYPLKWVCNFKGQKAIGICGFSQKICMFAPDIRSANILRDIVIGSDPNSEGYGCEEKYRCCNFDCKYCKIDEKKYLKLTDKELSSENILELKEGLDALNKDMEDYNIVPFDSYDVVNLEK